MDNNNSDITDEEVKNFNLKYPINKDDEDEYEKIKNFNLQYPINKDEIINTLEFNKQGLIIRKNLMTNNILKKEFGEQYTYTEYLKCDIRIKKDKYIQNIIINNNIMNNNEKVRNFNLKYPIINDDEDEDENIKYWTYSNNNNNCNIKQPNNFLLCVKDKEKLSFILDSENMKCENLCDKKLNKCKNIFPWFSCNHYQCIKTTQILKYCINCGCNKQILTLKNYNLLFIKNKQ